MTKLAYMRWCVVGSGSGSGLGRDLILDLDLLLRLEASVMVVQREAGLLRKSGGLAPVEKANCGHRVLQG